MSEEELGIIYPNLWSYKVIMEDKSSPKAKINEVLDGRGAKIALSKNSKNGKYVSFNVEVLVNSSSDKDEIFAKLCKISKYVL